MNKRGGKRKHPFPSQEVVRALFSYNENVKEAYLFWHQNRGSKAKGHMAGCKVATHTHKEPDRYMIKINGAMFNMRDLIWIYFKGEMPETGLMFKDGNPFNLRISNIVPRKPVVSFL